jgi:hypothetical protein
LLSEAFDEGEKTGLVVDGEDSDGLAHGVFASLERDGESGREKEEREMKR